MSENVAYQVKVNSISYLINEALIGNVDEREAIAVIGQDAYDNIRNIRKSIFAPGGDPHAARQALQDAKDAAIAAVVPTDIGTHQEI